MRILAINDLSCVGKCSLTVALPIISACGITCDVLPTAMLSTHTGGFQGYTFLDLTDEMKKITDHWASLKIKYDIIYSGYLGSFKQIEEVKNIVLNFLNPNGIFVVDPVMGDGGKLYPHFNQEFASKMYELCALADFVLPNLTEACYMTGIPYPEKESDAPVDMILDALKKTKTKPILTGIVSNGEITTYYRSGEKTEHYTLPYTEGSFHGSGDVFASAFVGSIARNVGLKNAVRLASDYTTRSIERTAKRDCDRKYGLFFEEETLRFLEEIEKFAK